MNMKKILFVSLGVSAALACLCGAVYALASHYRCQKPIVVKVRAAKPVKVFSKETWGEE